MAENGDVEKGEACKDIRNMANSSGLGVGPALVL